MNYRNQWLLLLATLVTLSVFLLAVGQIPGRVYLPVVVKRWHVPPTPRPTSMPTETPTATPIAEYVVTFAEDLSITSLNGSELDCRVGIGCALFMIQAQNQGNRSARYWLTKESTLPEGWGAFFCRGDDCFLGNTAPRVLPAGQKENTSLNFRVPMTLHDGDQALVTVQGYYTCDGCPSPTVFHPYTNQFVVLVILPTSTPIISTTPSPTWTATPTATATPTPLPAPNRA